MRKIRIGLFIGAVIIILAQLTLLDYNYLISEKNAGSFLGIISMICVIIVGLISYKRDKD